MCGQCHSYSNHLFGRLGPELGVMDGLTMKNDFCEELVDTCSGQGNIVFPSYGGDTYCEKHTGGGSDLFWAYPYTERERPLFGRRATYEYRAPFTLVPDLACIFLDRYGGPTCSERSPYSNG